MTETSGGRPNNQRTELAAGQPTETWLAGGSRARQTADIRQSRQMATDGLTVGSLTETIEGQRPVDFQKETANGLAKQRHPDKGPIAEGRRQ